MVNRFSVPNLYDCTKHLANVASRKIQPELILKNAHILSTYTNRILENKEIWISKGRIACIEENGQAEKNFNYKFYLIELIIHNENQRIIKIKIINNY